MKASLVIGAAAGLIPAAGCARKSPGSLSVPSLDNSFPPETILSSSEKGPVSFESMIRDLSDTRVIYVGESHSNARHHEIQLRILKALYPHCPDLSVGMEMLSRPYQEVLEQWKEGGIGKQDFIRRVHWYVNWKYDYGAYEHLLDFIRDKSIPVYALNIAFHVPPKIAAGGMDSLLPEDAARLPRRVNLSNDKYRQYVREIFEQHGFARKHFEFENFFQAQCVRDEVMAETISLHLNNAPMIVLAGRGHIARDYGIPDRAYARTGADFKIVLPVAAGTEHDLEEADYLWVIQATSPSHH
ncbi:MAG: ChaN family lipoprotein [Desulfobacteraceae bacterium]|nr:ChaN family lipoprotein [Desulfobacteraceae bacterium]